MAHFEIREATAPGDIDAVRALCWAYRDVLLALGGRDAEAVLHFYPEDKYADLMARLPELHARPGGSIKLGLLDGQPVACGMSHTFAPGVAEIKRVYVAPDAQGQGAGRAMMEALITQVRADGFQRIWMDTGAKLETAVRLYDRLGFRRRGPYQEIPEDLLGSLVFFEMEI